ncbi:RHS repeat-associated core domain-containing protein [Kitasatospora sp. NPDC049285]|uniref:RHS repeat-associated core domain-containing protein n=1 Tax=Kitasatospora sp. NPDC049285 TaxID=3157096 RepID=UPI00343ABE47
MCPGGEPVDMATGRMFIKQVDVNLPGSLPLLFVRNFESGYQAGRWMGPRWTCTFDERLEIDAEGVVYLSPDLFAQAYPHPEPGDPVHASAGVRWELALTDRGDYTLTDPATDIVREFKLQPGGEDALLTKVRDRHGRHYTLAYDEDGTPLSITHSGGYTLLVTTDNDRITALRLAGAGEDGRDALLLRYGYTDGHLSSVYNSSGKPMRFANDAGGRVLSWTDRNNSQYLYAYDAHDRVVDEGGADGALRFHFDYADPDPVTGIRVHSETNALGHTTRYHVNEHAQIVAQVDPLGNTVRHERDDHDRLLAETDPLGHTTRYAYDGADDLISVTRPDGEQAVVEYGPTVGLPTRVVEPGGATWLFTYDERGHRTSLTDPSGAVTSYGYDELGHLSTVADALGHTTRIRCDAAGLPVEITDAGGAVTRCERDAFGRVSTVVDALGGVSRFSWTVEGRPASRTAPDGSTESWTYDGEGNLLTSTDQLGRTTSFEYTHFEALAARTDPDGARTTFTHDAHMQLVAVADALGRRWEYRYDAAGRLVGESDFQGRLTAYQLDAAGRPVVTTNPLGEQIRYTYDELGRTVAKDAAGRVTRYAFDPAGRLVRAVGPDAEVTRTLDALGNLLTETVNGRTTSHSRDALGRRTGRTTPSGHTSTWTYDAAGRPSALTVPGGGLAFHHDVLGRELERTLGENLTLARTWDPRHRLTSQTLRTTAPAGPAVLQQHAYAYRPDGHLTGVDDLLTGPRTFDLDPAGRITAVHAAGAPERYSYDPAGNLTSAEWPATSATGAALGDRTYIGTQLTAAGGIRYEYDAAGRTVLRQRARESRKPDTWHYTWDAEGRLTEVTTPDRTRWRYRYDPFGRRIAKQRLAADGASVAEQIDFTWDGTLLAEQTTTAPYLPGPHTLSWDYHGLHPIAQSETITTAGPDASQEQIDRRFFAVVTDLIGTPTELVDPVTDTIAWRAVPTAWGNTTWPADSTTYTPLRFPGQYFDPETRLHYNLNRYYDPETARYTSPDPLGLVPSPNPDGYVRNPHTWSDPLGLSPHAHSRPALPPALREPPNLPGSPITSRLGRPGETFNMVISRGQPVSRPGGFGTFDDVPNQDFVRHQLAIRTDWKSDVSLVQRYAFPMDGEPIRIQESVIGPQHDPLLGHLPGGGATQLEILKFEDRARLIPVGDPFEIS